MLDSAVAEAQRISSEVDQRLNEGRREADLRRIVSETASARNALDSFFVSSDGTAEFITTIESLAEDAQVELEVTNVSVSGGESSEEDTDNLFEELTLDMNAVGSWQRIVHFVRLVESLPKDSVVRNVNLEQVASAGESAPQEWSVIVTLSVRKLP